MNSESLFSRAPWFTHAVAELVYQFVSTGRFKFYTHTQDGGNFLRAWLYQPHLARHLRHEGSNPWFSNGTLHLPSMIFHNVGKSDQNINLLIFFFFGIKSTCVAHSWLVFFFFFFLIFALSFRQLIATRDNWNYLFIWLGSLRSAGETPHYMNVCVFTYMYKSMYFSSREIKWWGSLPLTIIMDWFILWYWSRLTLGF